MGKALITWLFLASIFSVQAFAYNDGETPLDDLMSLDEIATEVGVPRTEMTPPHLPPGIEAEMGVILASYPLVVIINKNAIGYGAQTMEVYENGMLTSVWPVSTGRERWELAKSGRRYFSITPTGWYYPRTIKRLHWSDTWGAKMEFAVFFNGGVAVHATTPDHYRDLGTRASGGCVRLHYNNAEYFYNRLLALGKGLVPIVRRDGSIQRDRKGRVMYNTNWKTLIAVVE